MAQQWSSQAVARSFRPQDQSCMHGLIDVFSDGRRHSASAVDVILSVLILSDSSVDVILVCIVLSEPYLQQEAAETSSSTTRP